MMFFHFRQNNSGGCFTYGPADGIGINVIVEAEDWVHANDRAEADIGLYFNGCDEGYDCPCCGDRWYAQYHHSGDSVPSVYGVPIDEAMTYSNWGLDESGYVHYLDGRIVPFTLPVKSILEEERDGLAD